EDPQARLKAFIEQAERHLPQLRGAPVVALSAETGRGIDRLMPAVLKTHRDWSSKIKTRDLNDWLAQAVQRHPPPAVNGRRIKPKYMAQTKARPPTFVLFASRADQLPDSYRRYLVNSMRESFDMPGVPVRLTVKQNANPYSDGEDGQAAAPARKPAAKASGKPSGKPTFDKPASKFSGKPAGRPASRAPLKPGRARPPKR
ncbi:MAG: ribosome biogenesis GTPase Der, partial [Caulobacteraceae bacterium]|nr:ribosome biogenesis GTPase Der [Caulobacteraceae bacterium]